MLIKLIICFQWSNIWSRPEFLDLPRSNFPLYKVPVPIRHTNGCDYVCYFRARTPSRGMPFFEFFRLLVFIVNVTKNLLLFSNASII